MQEKGYVIMPEVERLTAFIDCVVSGDHVRAISDFYHADASMQENLSPPRQGLEALIEHEKRALARLRSMHTHSPKIVLAQGDNVVIHWIFDATSSDGSTRRLEELALQHWRGDRIQSERFFYDSNTAWKIIEVE